MSRKKPHIAVFFGGTSNSYDLSQETGYWVCNYIPRAQYNVTPVRVTPEGNWQVPLGALPQHGPITRMLDMLFTGLPALSPREGLERLLRHPVSAFLTTLRGHGGDDGAMHSLGDTLQIPVVGSKASTCQQTFHKHLCADRIDDIVSTPHTLHFKPKQSVEEITEAVRNELVPPLIVKPAAEEGSNGVEAVASLDELSAAIRAARLGQGEILVQEQLPGTEMSLTLIKDERGQLKLLPPTIIVPKKTSFYDHLAKRRPGRVLLHTAETDYNPLIMEAETIVRDVYEQLNCQGLTSFDLMHHNDSFDLLEVNTIPTLTTLTPLQQQLQIAGLQPTNFLDLLIRQSLN